MERFEAREVAGGIFVMLGLTLVAGLLFAIGQREGFLASGYTVQMRSRDLGGLSAGAPVVLRGLHIGYVKATYFRRTEQEPVPYADLWIFDTYRNTLPIDSEFRIESKELIGRPQVTVVFGGAREAFLHDGDVVEATASVAWEQLKTDVRETMVSLRQVVEESRTLVKRLQKQAVDGELLKIF